MLFHNQQLPFVWGASISHSHDLGPPTSASTPPKTTPMLHSITKEKTCEQSDTTVCQSPRVQCSPRSARPSQLTRRHSPAGIDHTQAAASNSRSIIRVAQRIPLTHICGQPAPNSRLQEEIKDDSPPPPRSPQPTLVHSDPNIVLPNDENTPPRAMHHAPAQRTAGKDHNVPWPVPSNSMGDESDQAAVGSSSVSLGSQSNTSKTRRSGALHQIFSQVPRPRGAYSKRRKRMKKQRGDSSGSSPVIPGTFLAHAANTTERHNHQHHHHHHLQHQRQEGLETGSGVSASTAAANTNAGVGIRAGLTLAVLPHRPRRATVHRAHGMSSRSAPLRDGKAQSVCSKGRKELTRVLRQVVPRPKAPARRGSAGNASSSTL